MNKKIISFVTIFFCFLSSVVLSENLSMDDLVKRNNLYYKKFTNVPFNGEVSGIENGSFKKGKKNGEWVVYYKNGQLRRKENYKDGQEDGLHESYYENGQLSNNENWKDGKLDGLTEGYHLNGQLEYKGNYKKGKIDGLLEFYYHDGQLRRSENHKDGKKDGLWITYHDNGNIYTKGNYKNGKRDGIWIDLDTSGKRYPIGTTSEINGIVVFTSGSGSYKNGIRVNNNGDPINALKLRSSSKK